MQIKYDKWLIRFKHLHLHQVRDFWFESYNRNFILTILNNSYLSNHWPNAVQNVLLITQI